MYFQGSFVIEARKTGGVFMADRYSKDKDYKVVAVVIGEFSATDPAQYLNIMAETCGQNHCRLVFFATKTDLYFGNRNDQLESHILELICVERYDAVIILTETFKGRNRFDALIGRANAAGVPVIAVDRELPGCINVLFDYKKAFRQVVEHMVEYHGYRRINFMNGRRGDIYSDERLEVYREVLEEHGIAYDPRRVYYGQFWEKPALQEMERMTREWEELPEAIVCANDAMAIAVNDFLKRRGYRVPEDVATTGFDGLKIGEYCSPRVTTGVHDLRELIRQVYDCVWNVEQAKKQGDIYVPGSLSIGCSCGCDGLKPYRVGTEMVKMRDDLHRESEFLNSMNEMIPVLTYDTSFKEAISAVLERVKPVYYDKLWLCSNMEDEKEQTVYRQKPDMWERLGNPSAQIYSDQLWWIYSEREKKEVQMDETNRVRREDLIPDAEKVLDQNDILIVTTMHLSNETTGYMVVTCDMRKFWVSAYSSFITSFRYIIELRKAQANVLKAYMSDPLTGLYNRLGFFECMKHLLEVHTDGDLALISMDLDGLKHINDTFGHAMGDEAIAEFGQMIRQSATGCLSTRIGGDEFLVAVFDTQAQKIAEDIAEKLREKLTAYRGKEDRPYQLEASIGIYTDRIQGNSLDVFMKKADALMYQNKLQHKNRRKDE